MKKTKILVSVKRYGEKTQEYGIIIEDSEIQKSEGAGLDLIRAATAWIRYFLLEKILHKTDDELNKMKFIEKIEYKKQDIAKQPI